MTLSQFFKYLGAPLKNVRWSWGAVRAGDGAVFLRVWQDECKTLEGRRCVLVSRAEALREDDLGRAERAAQVLLIKGGARCFLVMCLAKDPKASPRVIERFNREELFEGGGVIVEEGNTWLELAGRTRVDEVMTRA